MSLILSTVHISCSGDFGAHFICMFSAYYSLFMKKYSNCYIFNIYCRWSCEVLQNLTAFSDSKIKIWSKYIWVSYCEGKLPVQIRLVTKCFGGYQSWSDLLQSLVWWLPVLIILVTECFGGYQLWSDELQSMIWWLPVLIILVAECFGGCQSRSD